MVNQLSAEALDLYNVETQTQGQCWWAACMNAPRQCCIAVLPSECNAGPLITRLKNISASITVAQGGGDSQLRGTVTVACSSFSSFKGC